MPRSIVCSRCLLAVLLLGAGLAGAAESSDDAEAWLRRMIDAVQSLDYEGTFVYLRGSRLESMRLVHLNDGEHERERLLSLNGDAREVIRNEHAVTCIRSDTGEVFKGQPGTRRMFSALLASGLDDLKSHYAFASVGSYRVAERPAEVVAIIPRDAYRYGYRLYLDKHNALPLKTDLMDESGNPLEQIMFTSLHVGSDVDRGEIPSPIAEGHESTGPRESAEDPPAAQAPASRWRVAILPPGFSLTSQGRHGGASGKIEHLVFSDGLASLSVYIEKLDPGAEVGLSGGSRMGPVSAFGTRVDGHQVTAVGEVPPATARLAAESVESLGTATP